MEYTKAFLLLSLVFIDDSLSVKVFDTTNNIKTFLGTESGLRLENESLRSVNETTICFRFFNYKILNHQYLLQLGSFFIGTSLSKDNTLYSYGSEKYFWPENNDIVTTLYMTVTDKKLGFKIMSYELPDWPLNYWNSFCFTMSMVSRAFTISLNGRQLLSKDFKDITLIYETMTFDDMTLMAKRSGSRYRYSVFGKISDIHIWSEILAEKELAAWMNCSVYTKADSYDMENLVVEGLISRDENIDIICIDHTPKFSVSFAIPDKKLSFKQISEYCRYLGSEMSVASSNAKALEMLKTLGELMDNCGDTIYSGHKLMKNTSTGKSTFLDFTLQQPLDWGKWFPNEPNNYGGKEECVELKTLSSTIEDSGWGMNDIGCDKKKCPLCELPSFQQLLLRGACYNQHVDTVYYVFPITEGNKNSIELIGYTFSRISWNTQSKTWDLINTATNTIVATTNDTRVIPLGAHRWHFVDGKCNDGGINTLRLMNLHFSVNNTMFCCTDGLCVDWSLRCDNVPNCGDESDEFNCETLIIPDKYDETKPPINKNSALFSEDKIVRRNNVTAKFIIRDIYDIDEKASTLTVRFTLVREWKDPRLDFRDLSWDPTRNAIDVHNIWYPRFDQPSNLKTSITIEHHGVFVQRQDNFTRFSEKEEILRSRIFNGAENTIVMSQTQQVEVFCIFEQVHMYPFDNEKCNLEIAMKEKNTAFVNLLSQIIDEGPSEFSQYKIQKWTINTAIHDGKFMIKIELHLRRNMWMILLVVYLPTLMMTIINQSMNYLNSRGKEEFGNIIKVNVSCMIVISMIYNSVSTSLVSTPRIKMVELWLISSLIYPFVCIIINIRLRVLGTGKSQETVNVIKVQPCIVGNTQEKKVELDDAKGLSFTTILSFICKDKETFYLQLIGRYILPGGYSLFIIFYFTIIELYYCA